MERIIRDEIAMTHLVKNNLIADEHHGFVHNKSCITNLFETMDIITQAHASEYPIDILFLDFAKAFDSVSHSKLCKKLAQLGLNANLLKWCKGFLSSRTQTVVIGENDF